LSSNAVTPSGRCRPSSLVMNTRRTGLARYRPTSQPCREVSQILFQFLSVLLPRCTVNSRSCITFQCIVRFTQHAQVVDVVHQTGEPYPLIFLCCLPYPSQRTLHDYPIRCPVRVLSRRIPFGQTPLLRLLRRRGIVLVHRGLVFVRELLRYYESVRLPVPVHHRRTSLDFSMRPKRAVLGGDRTSRFPCKLFPRLPGVSDCARYQRPSPLRFVDCRLPHPPTRSASRTCGFSQLNTQPAVSSVNASTDGLLHPPHDLRPLWLARPLTYDSFIHYNLPVLSRRTGGKPPFPTWRLSLLNADLVNLSAAISAHLCRL
jgi:hypothetical protein